MRFRTLSEWLQWQETLHFTEVDPGLERIGTVWSQLGGSSKLPFTVVTVAGTNGKGSSVAILESILRAAGYKTGMYTSPHILEYNERICINQQALKDDVICQSFDRIDKARQQTSLTYFEFATLAAVDIFSQESIDIAILEVGMGGRLDAVNCFDADIALITPISLDHTHWLGHNRELIGKEKAGIIRANKPVVLSEMAAPYSIIEFAETLNSPLFQAGIAFKKTSSEESWNWFSAKTTLTELPFPSLEGEYQLQNAAAALQVISLLVDKGLCISKQHIESGLTNVSLSGRFQRLSGDVELILDVTHNEQGAQNLATLLTEKPCKGDTYVVLGMLIDKDATTISKLLDPLIKHWFVGGLSGSRGMTSSQLTEQLATHINLSKIKQCNSIEFALQQVKKKAVKGDRIVALGSFHTIEAVIRANQTDSKYDLTR